MTEPTIICHSRKTEIKLTESLAGPLIGPTCHRYQQRLAATSPAGYFEEVTK